MSITIDRDVEAAAALLQSNFDASRLVSIVSALADVAPVLWGRHGRDQVAPATLDYAIISGPSRPAAPIRSV